jgi:outer membrane protein assembly factor BamB
MHPLAHRGRLPLLAVLLLTASALGADWPQWLGPNRNGSSPETGLLTDWPKEGPKVLWKVPGGDGYSTVAVAGGKAVTMIQRDKSELVICLDAANGKTVWEAKIGPGYQNKFGDGPRATPAIDGNRVYVQSVNGPVVCLGLDKGKEVWRVDLLKEFKAENIDWGLSASPLIEGDLVLVIPGAKSAGVAALNKKDGKTVWKTGNDKAAYASPVAVTVDGRRQIIFFTAPGLLAVDPTDGKELWRVPWMTEYDVNISTPLVIGNQLFVASGEKVGSTLFNLKGAAKPGVTWESKGPKGVMTTYWCTAVAHDGHLYGLSGEYDGVINLNCVELKSGKLVWSQPRFGKGALTLADGHLFMTTKAGDLVLALATPKGYQEKARLRLLGDNRTAPTIADKKLFLRDRKEIFCLDIAGK